MVEKALQLGTKASWISKGSRDKTRFKMLLNLKLGNPREKNALQTQHNN